MTPVGGPETVDPNPDAVAVAAESDLVKKFKTLAIGLIAPVVFLTACSGDDTANQSQPSPTPTAAGQTDAPADTPVDESAPTVDRDPKGALPEITFNADGIPSMKAIGDEPPTQITVKTLTAGDGDEAKDGAFVKVNYAGFLWSDGKQFDSSFDRGEPTSFSLNEVVAGWKYGLIGTKVGDRVQIVVPPEFGYGDQENGDIPANSTLVFVVDVIGVTNIDTSALADATPTNAELPAGLTVEGDLGAEPKVSFAADAPAPTEPQVIVLAEGTGPEVTSNDVLFYHAVVSEWGGEPQSSWAEGIQKVEGGGGEETVGTKIGSRVLLVYPAEAATGATPAIFVLDLLAAAPAA